MKLAFLISLVGLVIYIIFTEKKAIPTLANIGEKMFWVGLLAWLLTGANYKFRNRSYS
jgi:hypothetical protein